MGAAPGRGAVRPRNDQGFRAVLFLPGARKRSSRLGPLPIEPTACLALDCQVPYMNPAGRSVDERGGGRTKGIRQGTESNRQLHRRGLRHRHYPAHPDHPGARDTVRLGRAGAPGSSAGPGTQVPQLRDQLPRCGRLLDGAPQGLQADQGLRQNAALPQLLVLDLVGLRSLPQLAPRGSTATTSSRWPSTLPWPQAGCSSRPSTGTRRGTTGCWARLRTLAEYGFS